MAVPQDMNRQLEQIIKEPATSSPIPTSSGPIPLFIDPACKIDLAGYTIEKYGSIFTEEGYTVLCNFGKLATGGHYYPASSQIVLNSDQFNNLLTNFENFLPQIAKDLGVTEQIAYDTAVDYFKSNQVVVKPSGVQGYIHNAIGSAQNGIASISVFRYVTGTKHIVQYVTQNPMQFVGATYCGALMFSCFGSWAGDTTLGLVFNATSRIFAYPMRGVEITLNNLVLKRVSNWTGLPLILNATDQLRHGDGILMSDYSKIGAGYNRMVNSRYFKRARNVWKALTAKDV